MDARSEWAEHVRYEWTMLRHAYFARCKPTNTPDEDRAATEDLLLHYRNLIDFLSPRPSARPSDLTAKDFTGNAYDAPIQWRDQIDRYLSHLTKTRSNADAIWYVDEMLDRLEAAWATFVADVDETAGYRFESVAPIPRQRSTPTVGWTTTSDTNVVADEAD